MAVFTGKVGERGQFCVDGTLGLRLYLHALRSRVLGGARLHMEAPQETNSLVVNADYPDLLCWGYVRRLGLEKHLYEVAIVSEVRLR